MSSTRLSEHLDHQALVAKLADTSEQCYKLLQLCNDLEKNLNDHNTDPEAHLDIRKAIEVVSGRLDTANTAFNTHISNIKNTYDAEVAELKKKDTDLENNLEEVSDKLDTVEKGEHVYDNSIKSEVVADDILAAAKGDAIIQSTTDKDGVVMLASLESPSGIYTLGSNHDEFEVNFHSDSDLAKNSPAATQSVVLLDKNGNSKFGKNVSAEQFTGKLVGDVTGNAATATNASKFNGLVASDFARTTGNVNQTITGTKTFKSPIVGNLQGTAGNADKLDNLDSSDFVRKTNNVAETITGNKTFSATVYGDSFQPKSGNKTGTIGTSDNSYKTIYVEHVEASTIAGNVTGNLTGNADTATKLRTPRKINDTDFDGTSAITTQIWGTTRNFYIADSTGKHTGIPIGVNGSGTVTLRLPPKIDAETTGNANTATKLATARKINGTDFDGTHDITTAYWGTRRNVYISDSDGTHTGIAVTMDGSGNVTLRLPGVIKADLIGNTTGVASNAENTVLFNGLTTGDFVRTTGNVNQTVTGTKTFNSPINSPVTTGTFINGNRGVAIINSTANAGYNVLFRMKSSHGVFTGCAWNQSYQINYTTDSIVNAGTNATTYTNTLIDENGNATFSNNITVRGTVNGNLNGNVTGNAATATKLAAKRTIALSGAATGTATGFDGSGNITIPVTSLDASKLTGTASVSTTGNAATATTATTAKACTGNAATATKLQTARTINGTSFNGTANITTANWGTARNISITDGTNTSTAVSVNGSANVSLNLPSTIKATFVGNVTGNVTGNCSGSSGSCTGNAATATKLATARSLWGNNFDGSAAITGIITGTPAIELMPAATSNIGGYLDFHYNHSTADYTSRIIESASGTLSINNVTITTGKVVTATTFNGALKGNVTGNCSGSSGSCTGNAATATKLAAKRTIALSGAATGTATGFDGSGNITIPVTSLDASKLTGTASVNTTGNAATATKLDTATLVSDLLDKVYPVGSIYMSAVNVSPASFLGGTWQAIEQGRMLMAAGSSLQAGTTGGAAYHTLTVQEMPAHDHSAVETAAGGHTHEASTDSAGAHSHSGSTNNAGNHWHHGETDIAGWHSHTRGTMNITGSFSGVGDVGDAEPSYSGAFYKTGGRTVRVSNSGDPDYVTGFDASRSWTGSTSKDGGHTHIYSTTQAGEHAHSLSISSAGAHTHSVAIAAAGAHTHAITIGKTGSGAAFSILPPYIAVYMWRRTA